MYGFADKLRRKGRFGDTLVAHLSEAEARFLKRAGGAGTVNPFTGALEYYKGTLGGRQSFYDELMPDQGAQDPGLEPPKKSGMDGFFKTLENIQKQNQPQKPDSGLAPQMLSFAKIMQKTFDRDDPGTEGGIRMEYTGNVNDIYDLTGSISYPLRNKLIDRFYGDTNENKLPGRVDEIVSYMFRKNDDGINAFEFFGGKEAYINALEQIGVTGEGKSYADRTVKGFIEGAESLAKALNQAQTSTTMGAVKGPQFAGSYKTFGEAKEAMFGPTGLSAVTNMLNPAKAFANLIGTGVTAITDPYTSWADALGRSFGFPDAQVGFQKQDVGFGIEDDDSEDDDGTGYGGGAG